jgi:hypothetical protein
MVCDLARLFSDNMAILNYQFGGIFAAFFAFRSNSSQWCRVALHRYEMIMNLFKTSNTSQGRQGRFLAGKAAIVAVLSNYQNLGKDQALPALPPVAALLM